MPALPNIFGQPFIQPSPQSPSPDALASALAGAMPAPTPVPPAEMRRRSNMVSALAAPPQQMTSPWQAVGAAVNGAADGYLDRQAQDAQQQALGQTIAQQNGVQGPVQPADVIQDQNKLFSLPSFDVGSVFGNWTS